MGIIIGVILGILIVFNWSSVKSWFDSSLSNQSRSTGKLEATPSQPPVQLAPPPQLPVQAAPAPQQSLADSVEQRLKDAAANRK